MPGYLERIGPRATLGTVFFDLYGATDQLIEELDEMRAGKTADRSRKEIPGTSLRFDWSSGRGEGKGSHCTTYVSAENMMDTIRLVARSRHVLPRQGAHEPEGVKGFRGSEVSPDYAIAMRPGGLIECRLGQLGIRGRRPDEPVGRTIGHLGDSLAGLTEADQQRIEVVGSTIRANLGAIESMALGASPQEALAEIGRPLVAA